MSEGTVTSEAPDDLLPDNATAFERAQSQTSARLLDAPTHVICDARRGASAPSQLLGHLAWERSVHKTSANVGVLRARIDSSFADHLSYGSPEALEKEIGLDVGRSDITIRDFFEVRGAEWPDFFIVFPVGPGHPAPPTNLATILRSALARKNVRDWPSIRFEARPEPATAVVSVGVQVRIKAMPRPIDGKVRVQVVPRIGVGAIVTITAKLEQL